MQNSRVRDLDRDEARSTSSASPEQGDYLVGLADRGLAEC